LLRLLCGRFAEFSGVLDIAEGFRGKNGFLDPSKFGVLLENPGMYPKLSVEEYVRYFAGFYGCGVERMPSLAKALELPALSTRLSALSLGNRQKVQILRAMIHNPKLLILDEPVANLDPASRESVWKLISDWRNNEGGTAIVCSHILAEMEQEATDFAIINRGTVLKSGSVSSAILGASQKGSQYNLRFNEDVSVDQIKAALLSAGISVSAIQTANSTLSDLYRETI